MSLLNIKPAEAGLVKQLFLIQFVLGVATAFLYTISLTLFLSTFSIKDLPKVFLLSAFLILFFNKAYIYFENRYLPGLVLQIVVLFSLASTFLFWLILKLFHIPWLILLLAAWNSLVYMLIGYAFWGLASLLYNVRESKRVFSIVGSGDIPAKMLGYLFVSLFLHLTDVVNLLWISIASLACCSILVPRLSKKTGHIDHSQAHEPFHTAAKKDLSISGRLLQFFHSKLVFLISLVSLLAFIIFLFVDFTFLAQIKVKYTEQKELASFIAVFFAGGRIFAILIKLLLSSRMIAKIGLLNSLMITPLLLLAINAVVIFSGGSLSSHLYIFGSMVLLIEILRSTVQEPVFFILFQPLHPHERLKGHLIAKGYTFPLALLGVGSFLLFYLRDHHDISILFLSKAMTAFLLIWAGVVVLIRKEYLATLVRSLRKGFFTGAELFLNDDSVFNILIERSKSNKPLEVINALNLLERSCYTDIFKLLIDQLQHTPYTQVREYVLDRIISNRMTSALPIIRKQIAQDDILTPSLHKALFYLDTKNMEVWRDMLATLDQKNKKAALTGMSLRKEEETDLIVREELETLAHSLEGKDICLALEVIQEAPGNGFQTILRSLLHHPRPEVYRKAIEVAGRVKDFSLFEDLFTVAVANRAWFLLQKALTEYGDEAFDETRIPAMPLTEPTQTQVIKAAARIKGNRSDEYLIAIFSGKKKNHDLIMDALWKKKASIGLHRKMLEDWVRDSLETIRTKVTCLLSVHNNRQALLLGNALNSEIQQNMETILKALALLYNREQIDQFIAVYKLENTTRVANAIEMLEMTIPKKFFSSVAYFIELGYDLNKHQHHAVKKEEQLATVLRHVVGDKESTFSSWSRSVALYLCPKLLTREAALAIASPGYSEDDLLVKETRNYVLSILK